MADAPHASIPTSIPTLKHWRSFGTAEWNHVKDGVVGLVLGSLLPVALFYVTYQTAGFSVAVVIVLVWSALVFAWHYRRTGGADVFSATTFGFACVKAIAGLASQSSSLGVGCAAALGGQTSHETCVYLAWPSVENLVYATAFFGSALLGRPLLALYAQRLYPIPREIRHANTFKRAFLVASTAWLIGHTLRAVVRLLLLQHLPLEQYLIADTVAGWPINIGLVAFTTWYPLREMRRAGHISLKPISSMDAVELAVEESAPTTV